MDTKALRQKILDLAIRGKLVSQDPNDEPASVLLERIREQKQQMVKDGKLKKKDIKNDSVIFVGEDNLHYEKFQDGTVKCIEDEIPFELPEGWAWSRYGCVVTLMSGTTYPAENELLSGDRLYVKVGDMNLPGNEREIVTSSRYLDEYNPSHLVPINSVIFPKRGGAIATNKKKLVLQKEILIDLNTMAFTPVSPVNLMYCYYWFLSIDLGKINSGSSVPQINNKDIEPLLFPIPPISEQEKIIQAITPLLDAEQRISSAGAEISRLVSCAKSEILDLAIRGQLVPQDPNDEPASVLLERIRAEKEELIKQGKIKRDNKESVIFRGEDNSYYGIHLPDSWDWASLREIALSISDGSHNPPPDNGSGIPLLSAANINDNSILMNEISRWITNEEWKIENQRTNIEVGDVLLTIVGSIGRSAVVQNSNHFALQRSVAVIKPCLINPLYLMHIVQSPQIQKWLTDNSKGTAQKGIYLNALSLMIIPIPPLAEQARIVEQIHIAYKQLDLISNALL